MNREEIEKDVEALLDGKDKLPAHVRVTFIAFLQVRNGLEIDQYCPYCNGLLEAELFESATTVRCQCGKSNNSWQGL